MTPRLPLSDQFPTMPDERDQISRGERATREIERKEYTAQKKDELSAIVAHDMIERGEMTRKLNAFQLANGPRADVDATGPEWIVTLRGAKGGS